jgi:hypothetical protein
MLGDYNLNVIFMEKYHPDMKTLILITVLCGSLIGFAQDAPKLEFFVS